ncbi:hypothetical protein FA15DRAFT_757550 [Coprinopsis marcescibilis]|uniref:Uncharacterized protein n=1 Tax=Coprinopsis marcescibilis TaxID=230819 RepID=A0A5C3L4D9_COPMA|nr:hypothetical protein FA15DRAFT_757550 [Coprinopsis marcescibilis]
MDIYAPNAYSNLAANASNFDKDHARLKSREAWREDERWQIDTRISQLQQLQHPEHVLLDLKIQRNQLSVISQLPSEMLSRIFIFVEWAAKYENPGYGRPRWVDFTYVSRHWRGVALGTPSLWSDIKLFVTPWLRAMLERSQHLPVDLTANLGGNRSPRLIKVGIETLKPHVSRLRQLELYAQRRDVLEQFLDILPTSLPDLYSLFIVYHNHYDTLDLPQNLFIDGVPKLREVALSGCRIPRKFGLFQPGLTFLHVSFNRGMTATDASEAADDFLRVLESMPALEGLSIQFVFPDFSKTERGREPIQLPCLESLSLQAELSDIADFLKLISIPTSAHVTVESLEEMPSIEAMPDFVAALHSSWLSAPLMQAGSPQPPPCMKALEVVSNDNYWCLRAWFTDVANCMDINLELTQMLVDANYTSEELGKVLFYLPLGDIRTLNLCGSITADPYMVSIGQWQSLKHISLDGTVIETFLEYMETDPSLSDGLSSTPTFLTSLEDLKITGADIYHKECPETLPVEALLDFLMIRYEFGSAIRSLKLVGYIDLAESEVERIRHIVGDIGTHWNGPMNYKEHGKPAAEPNSDLCSE